MCGIAGWVGGGSPASPDAALSAMAESQRHRGPDDHGQVLLDDAGLAFRRLALVDLEHGQQPCSEPSGRWWSIFNGEIYNHRELREDLRRRGHRITGTGDAQLIPHLVLEFGFVGMLPRLRGMFAIAVWDRRDAALLLARDRFGIKPLVYARQDGLFAFASEVRGLRTLGLVPAEPSPLAVRDYLAYGYVPEPETMWPGVHVLPAGCHLTVHGDQPTGEPVGWWRPTLEPLPMPGRDHDLLRELGAAVEDSVRVHLEADVPVGAYLSSGVDSSLLTTLAARRQSLSTFSIGFEAGPGSPSELPAARAYAEQLGTRHHESVVTALEYWRELPAIIAAQEQPLGDPSAPALWFLARQARQHVTAVLSGEGADELFAGYPLYREPAALRPVSGLPVPLRQRLAAWSDGWPDGRRGKSYLRRATTPLPERFLGNAPVFDSAGLREILAPDVAALPGPPHRHLGDVYDASRDLDDVARMQLASCTTWLPSSILAKADRMAMAHSLEVRVPLLDPAVFAVARQLPRHLRVQGRTTKVALRLLAEQVLPREIARRPKLGFPVPFRAWLDGPIGLEVRDLFGACTDPLLDRAALLRLLDDRTHPHRQRRVWTVMTYLLWRDLQHGHVPALGRGAHTIGS